MSGVRDIPCVPLSRVQRSNAGVHTELSSSEDIGGAPSTQYFSQHSASASSQHIRPKDPEHGYLVASKYSNIWDAFHRQCRDEDCATLTITPLTTTTPTRASCRIPCIAAGCGMQTACPSLRLLFCASIWNGRQIVRLACMDAADSLLQTQSGTR